MSYRYFEGCSKLKYETLMDSCTLLKDWEWSQRYFAWFRTYSTPSGGTVRIFHDSKDEGYFTFLMYSVPFSEHLSISDLRTDSPRVVNLLKIKKLGLDK